MADNVAITAGSGTTIAADDIGGVLHQRVKLSQGADGVGVDVSSAAPLQVTLANTGTNATPVVVDLGANNDVTVTGSVAVTGTFYQATQPVSVASVPLPTGASTEATLATRLTESDFDTKIGSLTETAPATDTASSGLNGRLQRIAQHITSLITAVGSPFQAGGSIGNTTFASTQAGTWTVQPGNTANTTAWKVDGSAVTQPVSMATNTPLGTVAHDSADSGAPIKTGGRAVSAEITPVTTGDRSDFITDLAGKQVMMPYANNENFVSGAITTAMTGTTSTSLVAAPAAGLRNYITTIIVSNSHGTVGTDVIIQDGSGGTTLMTIPAAALYGGAVINLPVPLRQPTTATAIYCANVTTGASTKVSAVGYKSY